MSFMWFAIAWVFYIADGLPRYSHETDAWHAKMLADACFALLMAIYFKIPKSKQRAES